jgi:hypothetical protein
MRDLAQHIVSAPLADRLAASDDPAPLITPETDILDCHVVIVSDQPRRVDCVPGCDGPDPHLHEYRASDIRPTPEATKRVRSQPRFDIARCTCPHEPSEHGNELGGCLMCSGCDAGWERCDAGWERCDAGWEHP